MADIPESDGKTSKSGRTDTARAGSVLHDHDFSVDVTVDEAGKIVFTGKTGPASRGPVHEHIIDAMASESDETEYIIETQDGSDGSEGHLIKVKLPGAMTTKKESQYSLTWTDQVTNTTTTGTPVDFLQAITTTDGLNVGQRYTIQLGAPNVITSKKTEHDNDIENGVVCFSKGFDGRRHYQGSVLAFCAAFAREGGAGGHIALQDDGRLKQMIFRTGTFVHPVWGVIGADEKRLANIKNNFDMDVLGQRIPMNIHHNNILGALGMHDELSIEPHVFVTKRGDSKKVEVPGHALWSYTELTPFGHRELIQDQKYFYASSELMWKMKSVERFQFDCDDDEEEDPKKKGEPSDDEEDDDEHMGKDGYGKMAIYRDLLVGSAATNTPFIPRLKSFAASAEDVKDAYAAILKQYQNPLDARKFVIAELNRRGIY